MPQAFEQRGSPLKSGASHATQPGRNLSLRFAVGSMSHAGTTLLCRTATAVGPSTAGTHISDGASLVVAARPSAGRSPWRVRSALSQRKSCRPTEFSSGTLPVMKCSATRLTRQLRVVDLIWPGARGIGGIVGQSNAKVSRLSRLGAWLGHGSKGGSSKAAPNHFIEGTAKGLRPSSAPHVER